MAVINAVCLRLLVLGALVAISSAAPAFLEDPPIQESCREKACNGVKPDMLNVHLVPHSHDDVGWLKTVDQYYFGSRSNIQRAGVQYILNSVISELSVDPSRKFIEVEMFFFHKWYTRQSEATKAVVHRLVKTGQLEFVGGAWSMNDEAATNYQSIVDQFTWGYRFLNDTFGLCGNPRAGWQLDPFGHSRGFATLLTQMGIDSLFFARIDHQDYDARIQSHTPEMVWKTSPNLGKKAELFTGVVYDGYGPPPGFCFDDTCGDEPINDDVESADYNVERRITDFINIVQKQAAAYASNHVMLTMGTDFQYQSATTWYTNLDRVIRYVNERQANGSKVNALYSTPSCYTQALHANNKTWTTKEDDFFPYSSDPHSFWAGYFTSRPTHKYMERIGNNFLQVSKQLTALAALAPEDEAGVTSLREAMGIVQHHDAITGTEKQHVANDYARLLYKAFTRAADTAQKALQKLTSTPTKEDKVSPPEFKTCFTLNISQCETTETKKRFVVTVYNPIAQKDNVTVRFPVQKGTYSVLDSQGKEVEVQLIPIPHSVLKMAGRESSASYDMAISAENLPPLGFRSYYIDRTSNELADESSARPVDSFKIGSEHGLSVEVDSETGLLKRVAKDGDTLDIKQGFFYYKGALGENDGSEHRSSGAYIFRPNGTEHPVSTKASVKVYKGPLVEEIHQTFSDWVTQVIRISTKNQATVEFNWQVGPIPIDDNVGKEIIVKYETELQSKGIFYTDSNGREILQRVRNARPTYKPDLKEEIAGNYYPVTSRISIRDEEKKLGFGVLVDRAEGGSSLQDGNIEIMLHRRLLHDDAFGVGEALNETAFDTGLVARGTHVLFIGDENLAGQPSLSAQTRIKARRLLLQPWLFFSDATNVTLDDWKKNYVMEWSGLNNPLPDNLHLMTLEPWKDSQLLVRVEHIVEQNEDSELSKPASFDLQTLLKSFNVQNATETTLAANFGVNQNSRLTWNTAAAGKEEVPDTESAQLKLEQITLNPMEIRTFVVDAKKQV